MKNLLRRVAAVMIAVAALYGVFFLYLGPRWTGDSYIRALQSGDSIGVRAAVCQDSLLSSAIGSGSSVLAALGVTPGGEARFSGYVPVSGAYTFDWVIGGVAGLDVSTPVRLTIVPTSAFAFCVREIALEG